MLLKVSHFLEVPHPNFKIDFKLIHLQQFKWCRFLDQRSTRKEFYWIHRKSWYEFHVWFSLKEMLLEFNLFCKNPMQSNLWCWALTAKWMMRAFVVLQMKHSFMNKITKTAGGILAPIQKHCTTLRNIKTDKWILTVRRNMILTQHYVHSPVLTTLKRKLFVMLLDLVIIIIL